MTAHPTQSTVIVDVEQDMPNWTPPDPVRISMEGWARREHSVECGPGGGGRPGSDMEGG